MRKNGRFVVSWLSVLSLLMTMFAVSGLVIPMAASAETVYYSENFNSYANGTLPSNWTISSDSGIKDIKVQDGALVINGIGSDSQTRVFYTGSELKSRGDYVFEADYTILQSDYALSSSTRYTGMIFRASEAIEPYYYVTTRVRTGTTNNELSIRNAANSFKQIELAPAPFDQALNTTYHLKVICSGPSVKFYINDSLVFNSTLDTTGAAYKYLTTGSIGFTTSNLKIKIDNITVKEFTGAIVTQPAMFDTYIPDTNIVNPPSVITNVTSEDVYASVTGTKLPSTTLYYLNSDLNITTPDGKSVIASLSSALNMTNGKVIPALYVKDTATVDKLATFATEIALKDAFLVADNVDLLKYARNKISAMYGVLYTKLTSAADEDDLAKIYSDTNKAWAKTAMIDADYLSKDDVEYLQKRLLNVWVIGDLTMEQKFQNIYKGVNGIVDTDHAGTLWIYENTSGVFNSQSDTTPILIRSPFMYAHRGYSAYANQNTMEAFYGAMLYGADLIEMDVRLTKDGVVVIYHDEYLHTLTTCTDTTKKVENSTYAELMQYEVDDLKAQGVPNSRIATLDEFLDLIDSSDGVVGIVEIKNYDSNLVDRTAQVIRDKGMEDKVVSICFGQGYCDRMRAQLPGVSVGWLANAVADHKTPAAILNYAKGFIMGGNLSYHPNFGQIQTTAANSMTANMVTFAGQRGLNLNPWTYNAKAPFETAYVGGIQGITTDHLEYDNGYIRRLDAGRYYQLKEGTATAVQGLGYTSQETALYNTIVKRTGGANITFNNADGKVTASGTGTATCLLMYKTTTSTSGSFYVISDLTSVTVTTTGGTTLMGEYRESLLPPYITGWKNSMNNLNITATRDNRGDVLKNTSGQWPAVDYIMTDSGNTDAIYGVTASLNDSIVLDATVGNAMSLVIMLSDGTNYEYQKYIPGATLSGSDLVAPGARVKAKVKLADMIPSSSATNGKVTITCIRVFNIGDAGTELILHTLDLSRAVPALYGLIGDVDEDNTVDTGDVRIIINSTIGKASLGYKQVKLADVTGDGNVDSTDARTLLKSLIV
ncbi:MAG: hypothetical protein IJB27_01395 [Clostridia bacterium]|nr:hypothetical protein [Clostridia bacterium]